MLGKCMRDSDRLRALQPSKVQNEVQAAHINNKKGVVNLNMTRYKTRIRDNENQVSILRVFSRTPSQTPLHRGSY